MTTRLERIALRFEPKIRDALLEAFKEIRDSITLDRIENAINIAGISGAYRVLADLQIEGIIEKHLVAELNQEIAESGRTVAEFLPAKAFTNAPYSYSIINPATVNFISAYELDLIQKISVNTRNAIRQSIDESYIAGVNPKVTAKSFKNTLGLTDYQEKAVRNYQRYLEELDITALERDLRDKRFDRTIVRAIEEHRPLPKDQITKIVDQYRKRYLNYRAETIARTEALRATSVGEYSGLLQGVASGSIDHDKVLRFWINSDDHRVRNHHRVIDSMNPDGVYIDQPFQTPLGPLLYPRDPNGSPKNVISCRCRIGYRIVGD